MFQEPSLPFLVYSEAGEEEHKFSQSPIPHFSSIDAENPILLKKTLKKPEAETPKSKRVKVSEATNPNKKFGHWCL